MLHNTTVAPHDIDRNRARVGDAYREVRVGDTTITGADLTVRVTHSGTAATFVIEVWDLTASTFRSIARGDDVQIRLGWTGGPRDVICNGVVTTKDTHSTGGGRRDHAYRIRGRSVGAQAIRQRLTATYRDATTHDIIRDLAARLDLDTGYLGPRADADAADAAPVIDGCWQLRDTQRVRAGLDRLAERAGQRTGHQFEWYVDRGTLAFHPKRRVPDRDRDRVAMSTADSIRRLQPAHGHTTHTNDAQPMKLRAYCQPTLRKHARLAITHTAGGDATQQGGEIPTRPSLAGRNTTEPYRCVQYRFYSSTTPGTHTCEAVVVPMNAQYRYDHTPSAGGGWR